MNALYTYIKYMYIVHVISKRELVFKESVSFRTKNYNTKPNIVGCTRIILAVVSVHVLHISRPRKGLTYLV